MSFSEKNCRHFAPLMGYCDHRIQTLMEARLRPYNVSSAQCRTLLFLHEAPCPVNHRDLAQHLMVKPSTVNGIVCRLEEKGLLRRTGGEKDGRCKYLSLTERGEEFFATFCAVVEEVNNCMEQGFTQEELDLFNDMICRVAHNLSEKGDGDLCSEN